MQKIVSDGADIFYDVAGAGASVVLLHPFPVHHEFWLPATKYLASRYRLIMPDLRGHGESGPGHAPAPIQRHAADVAHVMTDAGIDRAPLIGVSIGGYTIFEFLGRFRDRLSGLVLCNTKAPPDIGEAKAARLEAANDVLQRGTEPFFEGLLKKALAESRRQSRPHLVDGAPRCI